jgi:uncharacterized membrane protein YqgA involved in biofilm formation
MEIVTKLINVIVNGGSSSIIAILLLAIGYLVYEKIQLERKHREILDKLEKIMTENHDSDSRALLDIIDRYHAGQMSVVDAIQQLHVLLARIDGRL